MVSVLRNIKQIMKIYSVVEGVEISEAVSRVCKNMAFE